MEAGGHPCNQKLFSMKSILFTGWNAMRIIRLVAGVILLISAFVHRDTLIGGFGIFFTLQGLFNFSSCGMGGCYTSSCASPRKFSNAKHTEDIQAEIIE